MNSLDNLVSIIMPVYNSEEFISEAINSVLNQSYENLELIIVNDASKDNSRNIIEKFCQKDKRINSVHLNTN